MNINKIIKFVKYLCVVGEYYLSLLNVLSICKVVLILDLLRNIVKKKKKL